MRDYDLTHIVSRTRFFSYSKRHKLCNPQKYQAFWMFMLDVMAKRNTYSILSLLIFHRNIVYSSAQERLSIYSISFKIHFSLLCSAVCWKYLRKSLKLIFNFIDRAIAKTALSWVNRMIDNHFRDDCCDTAVIEQFSNRMVSKQWWINDEIKSRLLQRLEERRRGFEGGQPW